MEKEGARASRLMKKLFGARWRFYGVLSNFGGWKKFGKFELNPDGVADLIGVGVRKTCNSSSVKAVRAKGGHSRVITLFLA